MEVGNLFQIVPVASTSFIWDLDLQNGQTVNAYSGCADGDDGRLLASIGDFRTVAFTGATVPVTLIVGCGVLFGVEMCQIAA